MSLLARTFHHLRPLHRAASGHLHRGLDEFFEGPKSVPVEKVHTGRPWDAAELRNKSFDDLHKLWYVLLKERNMLATQKEECKRLKVMFLHQDRDRKCRLSMKRIKFVLRERQLLWQAAQDQVDRDALQKEIEQVSRVLEQNKVAEPRKQKQDAAPPAQA
ncbi:54S ribosomal protein L4 mitochondrial [Sorochytrium milnesiophthora]